MYPASYDVKEFYARPIGGSVQRLITRRILQWWPPHKISGLDMVGYGYALPYLNNYLQQSRTLTALMPADLGGMKWPDLGPQISVLTTRNFWPLPDASCDRLLVMHDLEYAENPARLLDEAWRVLKPEGRMIVVVPNRTGFWARAEATPFGQGRPYTRTQLHDLLRERDFAVERFGGALLAPPLEYDWYNTYAAPWLDYVAPLCTPLCGAWVVEASKRLFAPIRGTPKRTPAPRRILMGQGVPVPSNYTGRFKT